MNFFKKRCLSRLNHKAEATKCPPTNPGHQTSHLSSQSKTLEPENRKMLIKYHQFIPENSIFLRFHLLLSSLNDRAFSSGIFSLYNREIAHFIVHFLFPDVEWIPLPNRMNVLFLKEDYKRSSCYECYWDSRMLSEIQHNVS